MSGVHPDIIAIARYIDASKDELFEAYRYHGDIATLRHAAADAMLRLPDPAVLADLLDGLKLAREELVSLPHSLGYDFTHIPKIDAAIAVAEKAVRGDSVVPLIYQRIELLEAQRKQLRASLKRTKRQRDAARQSLRQVSAAADRLANVPFGVQWDTGLLPRIDAVNEALRESGRGDA